MAISITEKIQTLRDTRTMLEAMVLTAVYDLLQLDKDDARFEFNAFSDWFGDEFTVQMSFMTKTGRTGEWIHIPCEPINDYYNNKKAEAMEAMKSQRDAIHLRLDSERYEARNDPR